MTSCCGLMGAVCLAVVALWCAVESYGELHDPGQHGPSRIQRGQCWTEVTSLALTSCYDGVEATQHELPVINPFRTAFADCLRSDAAKLPVRRHRVDMLQDTFGFTLDLEKLPTASAFDQAVTDVVNDFPTLAQKAERVHLEESDGAGPNRLESSPAWELYDRHVPCADFSIQRWYQTDRPRDDDKMHQGGLKSLERQRKILDAPALRRIHFSLIAAEVFDEYIRTIAPRHVATTGLDLLSIYAMNQSVEHRDQLLQKFKVEKQNVEASHRASHAEAAFKHETKKSHCYWLNGEVYGTYDAVLAATRGRFWTVTLGFAWVVMALSMFAAVVLCVADAMQDRPDPKAEMSKWKRM